MNSGKSHEQSVYLHTRKQTGLHVHKRISFVLIKCMVHYFICGRQNLPERMDGCWVHPHMPKGLLTLDSEENVSWLLCNKSKDIETFCFESNQLHEFKTWSVNTDSMKKQQGIREILQTGEIRKARIRAKPWTVYKASRVNWASPHQSRPIAWRNHLFVSTWMKRAINLCGAPIQ